jgi:RNA polymerase sigma factor (TIGR02999 family)
MSEVTQILHAANSGDRIAAEKLLPLVYEELRKLAAARLAREAAGQTLQPTALVHEAWLRLTGDDTRLFEGRAHFFGAAAEAMRRILVDRARRRHAVRHGGSLQRVDLEGLEIPCSLPDDQVIALDELLDQFAQEHPKPAELIKLRYFAGLTVKEAAAAMGISPDSAKDYSAFARAWLLRELLRNQT